MSKDVSPHVPSGTYFFTLRLRDHRSRLLVDHVDLLRQAIRVTRKVAPFEINAAVVLPAVLHMIWTLPVGDANHAIRWRRIKATFSRHLPATDEPAQTTSMQRRREKGVWQRRYWDHLILDQADFDLHEHLIIHAPVTAGLVRQPRDWALSSLHQRGIGKTRIAGPVLLDLTKTPSAAATLF